MAVDYAAINFNLAAGYEVRIADAQKNNDTERLEKLNKGLQNSPNDVKEYYHCIQLAKTDAKYAEKIASDFKDLRKEVINQNKNRRRNSKPVTPEQVLATHKNDDMLMNVMIFGLLMQDNAQVETLPQPLQDAHKEFGGFGGGSTGGGGAGGSFDNNTVNNWENNLNTIIQDSIQQGSGYQHQQNDWNNNNNVYEAPQPVYEAPTYTPDPPSYTPDNNF